MYTKTTPNYNLPQYQADDRFDPMADFNPAFTEIDKQMALNAQGVATIPDINQTIANLQQEIAQVKADTVVNGNNIIIAKNAADNAMLRAQRSQLAWGNVTAKKESSSYKITYYNAGDAKPWGDDGSSVDFKVPTGVIGPFVVTENNVCNLYGYSSNLIDDTIGNADTLILEEDVSFYCAEKKVIISQLVREWWRKQSGTNYAAERVPFQSIYFPVFPGTYWATIIVSDEQSANYFKGLAEATFNVTKNIIIDAQS